MVLGIQIIGVIFGLLMMYITFINLKRKEYEIREFVLWMGIWVFFLFFTIFPQVLDIVTQPLSIVRKLDLLVIMGMLFVIGISYYNYSITRKTQRKVEQVVRAVALREKKAKKMNLLFVLENYLPHLGGVEVVFKNLCEGLVKEGHKVTILTHKIKGTKKREVMNGVTIRRVSCFDSRYLFTFAAPWQAFKLAKNADVIHTTAFNGAPPGWIAGFLRRKPTIIHVHEIWIGKWRQVTSMGAIKAFFHDVLERCIYLLPYNKYVCVSQATQRELLKQKRRAKKKKCSHP